MFNNHILRNLAFSVAFLFSASLPAFATIVIVDHTIAGSSNTTSVTTSGRTTTGSSTIFVGCSGTDTNNITDSKSNTWTALTVRGAGIVTSGAYCTPCNVGTSHTFTCTAASTVSFPVITVLAWSGGKTSSPLDAQDGNQGTGITALAPGTLVPSENGEIVITVLSFDDANTAGGVAGYTIADQMMTDGAFHIGAALAYLIQTTAGSTAPNWTWSISTEASASISDYKSAPAAATSSNRNLLGVGK